MKQRKFKIKRLIKSTQTLKTGFSENAVYDFIDLHKEYINYEHKSCFGNHTYTYYILAPIYIKCEKQEVYKRSIYGFPVKPKHDYYSLHLEYNPKHTDGDPKYIHGEDNSIFAKKLFMQMHEIYKNRCY